MLDGERVEHDLEEEGAAQSNLHPREGESDWLVASIVLGVLLFILQVEPGQVVEVVELGQSLRE